MSFVKYLNIKKARISAKTDLAYIHVSVLLLLQRETTFVTTSVTSYLLPSTKEPFHHRGHS